MGKASRWHHCALVGWSISCITGNGFQNPIAASQRGFPAVLLGSVAALVSVQSFLVGLGFTSRGDLYRSLISRAAAIDTKLLDAMGTRQPALVSSIAALAKMGHEVFAQMQAIELLLSSRRPPWSKTDGLDRLVDSYDRANKSGNVYNRRLGEVATLLEYETKSVEVRLAAASYLASLVMSLFMLGIADATVLTPADTATWVALMLSLTSVVVLCIGHFARDADCRVAREAVSYRNFAGVRAWPCLIKETLREEASTEFLDGVLLSQPDNRVVRFLLASELMTDSARSEPLNNALRAGGRSALYNSGVDRVSRGC